MYARLSESELIARSQVIVKGRYLGQIRVDFEWGKSVLVGAIEVESVLKGDAGLKVVYCKAKEANNRLNSEDIAYKEGQAGLWLLAAIPEKPGLHEANHPQRFVPEGDSELIHDLEKALGSEQDD